MGTPTSNYGFDKPTVGGDEDNWGDDYSTGDPLVDPSPGLNGNWEKVDQLFKQMQDTIDNLINNVIPSLYIPIGGLYISEIDTDPSTTLGYGTWEAWGLGRSLVGAGDAGAGDRAAGAQFGNDWHTLTQAEIPAHTHWVDPPSATTSAAGSHNHAAGYASSLFSPRYGKRSGLAFMDQPDCEGDSNWGGSTTGALTSTDGNHSHTVDIPGFSSGSIGSSNGHNNAQYSQAAYIWKRIT